ncbi:MAG: class I SAM-dependent methyltransferase [Candidatus Sungiibacteriota bacterium]|uniref:Class I SAM-dependent methyltransferase n=1 Tax=Candidatus Sungiibacteriota bacterium TaxID=2750080 RepID=A0A7T5URH3_9BACT|nr:MAG: class I SAM-dependent methyltransferase [Candidatus Sungbacteria bacterium]
MTQQKKLILDIGCGANPWPIVRSFCLSNPDKYAPVITPIIDEYVDLSSENRFICLDKNADSIQRAIERLKQLTEIGSTPKSVCINFVLGDGRKLCLPNQSVDIVIISGVFSAPPPGTTPRSEPYPQEICISELTKWEITKEAFRVLKNRGVLIVIIQLTPCYALSIMERIEKELIAEGRLKLIKQCGRLINSDDWHLYHAAFQKNPQTPLGTAEIIPWTPAQEKYIKDYASSWVMY